MPGTLFDLMNLGARRWIFVSILSALAVLYLLGNASVQLWDRDEPRYAQTSRQMLQSGDWVVPRFLDQVRTAKPVLIYWCQASSMGVFGDNAFAARFPSVVAMLLTLVLLAEALRREAGSNRALWTIFIFGTCALAIGSAKMSLTDAVLLLFITIGQLCLYRLWRYGFCGWTVIVLGIAIGLAGLTKGPVAVGVHAMTALALWGMNRKGISVSEPARFQAWHLTLIVPLVLGVMFVVVFPWLYLIQNRAPGFLTTSIGHDVIERARSGHEGHSWPPGFYTLAVWGTYFPWSLLIPAAVVNAWQQRHQPLTRFALAAWIGPWVMFELVAGKLPHYVLPTYPAIAYLIADMLLRASRGAFVDLKRRDFRIAIWVWAGIVSLLGLGAWAGLVMAGQFDLVPMIVATAISIVAIIMGVMTARRFGRGRIFAAARVMGIGMMVWVGLAYALFLPRYQPLRISAQVAKVMRDHGGYAAYGYMIDYKEPSLAFHQGGGLREQSDDNYLNDSPSSDWPEWVVLTKRVWDVTDQDVQAHWQVIGTVRGLAYNEGGKQEVLILHRALKEARHIVAP